MMSPLFCIVVAQLRFLLLVVSLASNVCHLCVKLSRNKLHSAKQVLTEVRWTHGQIDGHRCPGSPLFDAHDWPAALARAESSWGQRHALAVRYTWYVYKVLRFILSLTEH